MSTKVIPTFNIPLLRETSELRRVPIIPSKCRYEEPNTCAVTLSKHHVACKLGLPNHCKATRYGIVRQNNESATGAPETRHVSEGNGLNNLRLGH